MSFSLCGVVMCVFTCVLCVQNAEVTRQMTVARAAQDEVEAVRKEMLEKVKAAQEAADRQVRMNDVCQTSDSKRSEKKGLSRCGVDFSCSGAGAVGAASGAPERADISPRRAGLPKDHHGCLTTGHSPLSSSQLYGSFFYLDLRSA